MSPPISRSARLAGLLSRGLAAPLGAWFAALDWPAAQRHGAALGALGWHLARRDRTRTLEHLAIAFPELAPPARAALARDNFRHLGTLLGECLWLLARPPAALAERVAVEGWEHVEREQQAGRSIVIVTGHCGNWEMLAGTINGRGLGMAVVARELQDAFLDRLLLDLRLRYGTTTIQRGRPGAARELLRVVRSGGALGLLIDQDTRVDGVFVPFFGRPAFTPVGAAELALRFGAAVVPAFIARRADGSHLARFHPALQLPDDPTAATALMTEQIEAQIRRHPEQWVWLHRRWRHQPPT